MSRNFATDDKIDVGSPAVFDEFFLAGGTYALWFKITDVTISGRLVDHRGSGTVGNRFGPTFFFTTTNDKVGFYHDFTTSSVSWTELSDNTITQDIWYFYAVTYNSSSSSNDPIIYRNGVAVSLIDVSPSGTQNHNTSSELCFGAAQQGSNYLTGNLAHIQLFNRVLSPEEIKQIMRFPGSIVNGRTGYWPLFGSASPEPDYSGNGNHGTVTGAIKGTSEPQINGIFQVPKPELITSF